ncbi:MAG: putative metalloprotease CJM1_0395 family protein, partial [Gammaproteobacteria bacterium]
GDKTVSAVEKSNKNNDVDDSQVKKDEKSSNEKETNNKHEGELDQQELSQLRTLQNRDREVRAHEQAHIAAAGSLAKGGASFEYKRGPDGQRYAVGGEMQIDTSTVSGDPEATAAKAQQIRRAAFAPAQPSQQDRSVAAAASTMEAKARIEITQQKMLLKN